MDFKDIKEIVDGMPAGVTFGDMFSAMSGLEPSYAEPNTWAGPGYYDIIDDFDGCSTIQYCETEGDIADVYVTVRRFCFVCEDVPQILLNMVTAAWDGPGEYAITRIREIAWAADADYVGWGETPECLADGAFRAFGDEVIGFRKLEDGADTSGMPYVECPDEFHGPTNAY